MTAVTPSAPVRIARPRSALVDFASQQPLGTVSLVIILMMTFAGIFAEWVAPYDPLHVDFAALLQAPSREHWGGTDAYGRDIFSRWRWHRPARSRWRAHRRRSARCSSSTRRCSRPPRPSSRRAAAARIRLFSPAELRSRLSLRLLGSGSSDLPDRQQTLLSTIDWSYELLDEPERTMLQRLAVFAGGCTLDAADAVAAVGFQDVGVADISAAERSGFGRGNNGQSL